MPHYREQLEACRQELGGGSIPLDEQVASIAGVDEPPDEELVVVEDYCRVCGRRLEVESIPRAPPPAELAKYLEAAA